LSVARTPLKGLRPLFSSVLPKERIHDDALSLTAVATDASFYQVRPRILLDVLTPDEMLRVLDLCARERLPVTFRAAGTSLSGQALGEGVLIRIARGWRGIRVSEGGTRITLEPGVIGAQANRALKPYARKIGPDPATIHNCMIGGIVANNASGMCCGTDQNTYRTMESLKAMLVLKNGLDLRTVMLDTSDAGSRAQFAREHPEVLNALTAMRNEVLGDSALAERIRRKYRIKNTLGYSLNALVDFEDPIEILAHLMVGSEGTLGFISEITYRTVDDFPHRSCALLYFKTLSDACRAAAFFQALPIQAAELMDRTSLRKVEDRPGMPAILKTLDEQTTALLIETRASNPSVLKEQVATISKALEVLDLVKAPEFSSDPKVYEPWWDIRRGLFPSVGRGRKPGTVVIIEDVAFPIESLASATEDLVRLFREHGYEEAILFGHALAGNLHFSFAQDFQSSSEIERYAGLMSGLADLGVRWDGSLKAEHGTGRNMAPFVEREWGAKAYSLMKRIKAVLDPSGLFNPGVLLNDSPTVHLESLKTIPAVDPLIDECIECGFCEVHCPSRELTVTPRQRIAAFRELARRGHDREYESRMQYSVEKTCAADGLCATACPVAIDTGVMIKQYRARRRKLPGVARMAARGLARVISRRFAWVLACARAGLRVGGWIRREWPRPASLPVVPGKPASMMVVYFPSCISRTMGASHEVKDSRALPQVMNSIFQKAGIEARVPDRLASLCCGLPFESKGFPEEDERQWKALERELLKASENGRHLVVSDTSPCTQHLKKKLDPRLRIVDSVEFLHELILKGALKPRPTDEAAAIHVTCSAVEMGLASTFAEVARACSRQVIIPEDVGCCGFAGDKGFTHPELTRSALKSLRGQLQGCHRGFSNSRTCEIGLSREAEIPYQSLAHLVDQVT